MNPDHLARGPAETRPGVSRWAAIGLVAAVTLVPALLPPGAGGPHLLWRSAVTAIALLWLAGMAASRVSHPVGFLVPVAAASGWLFVRSSWVLPRVPGPEDLLAALAVTSLWPASGPAGALACDLALLFAPLSWLHAVGGLPELGESACLISAGAAAAAFRPSGAAGSRRAVLLAAVLVLVALGVTARTGRDGSPKRGRIVFDESHAPWGSSLVRSIGNSAPDSRTGTGHGDLAILLETWGYSVTRMERWGLPGLALADTLVLPFPTRPFSPAERRELEEFVRQGGGLLAIGEHTNMHGVMESLNPALEPFGLGLNDDTVWLEGAQRERLAHASHPLVLGADHLAVANGASVFHRGHRAFPLVSASWGVHADSGNPLDPGHSFLGDSRYDPREERSRDLPLAAAASFGRGRVILTGDSAGFQNGGLYDAPLSARAYFHWLDRHEGLPIPIGVLRAATLGAGWVLLLAGLSCGTGRRAVALTAAAALLAVQLVSTLSMDVAYGAGLPPMPELVVVDQAHGEALALYHRRRTAPATALDAALSAIQRAGKFPWVHRDGPLDRLPAERVAGVVLPGPRVALSASELAWLDSVVRSGGVCLAVVDPSSPSSCAELLSKLGLGLAGLPAAARKPLASEGTVYQLPSGAVPVATAPGLPGGLTMVGPFELEALASERSGDADDAGGSIEWLARHAGAPVIARTRRGRGAYVVLADPALLEARSMELSPERVRLPRLRFLAELFSAGRAASSREGGGADGR